MEYVPKLKEMKREDIPGYIWDYYKIPIIAGIAAVLLIIYFVHGQLTKKESMLVVAAANCYSLELSDPDALFSDFMEQEGFDINEQEVSLNTSLSYSADSANVYGMSAIVTVIGAHAIDVAIWDDELFADLGRNGAFVPLSDYLTEDEIAALGDRAVICEYDIYDSAGELTGTESYLAGIRLSDNEWVEASGLYPTTAPIITLLLEPQHYATAVDFIRYVAL